MTPNDLIWNLQFIANKHRNDKVFTGEIKIADMAEDCISVVEELLNKLTWIPVTERLPLPPEYDWVLVRAIFKGDSQRETVPHVAELRDGKWYGRACEGPLEETLEIKVVAWFDMQQLITRTSFAHKLFKTNVEMLKSKEGSND